MNVREPALTQHNVSNEKLRTLQDTDEELFRE